MRQPLRCKTVYLRGSPPSVSSMGFPGRCAERGASASRSALNSKQRRVTPLHFLGGDLFDRVADQPAMAEEVEDDGGVFAIERVAGRALEGGTGGDGTLGRGVGVVEVQADGDGCGDQARGGVDSTLGKLVAEHPAPGTAVAVELSVPAAFPVRRLRISVPRGRFPC